MMKLLVLVAACVGTWFLLNKYLPSAHVYGFTLQGHWISAVMIAVVVMAYLVYKMKSK